MKKIISLALTLVLAVSLLASCSLKKDTVDEIWKDSEPTRIVTIIDYVLPAGESGVTDTLKTMVTTTIDRTNQRALADYSRQRYASFEEMSPTRIVTDKGQVYYDMVSQQIQHKPEDGEITFQTVTAENLGYALNIERSNFKTYEKSDDANSITATFSPDKAPDVLGQTITTQDNSDISIIIGTNGEYLDHIEISYTAGSGAKVIISTSYTYDKRVTVEPFSTEA